YRIDLEPILDRAPFYLDPDSLELISKDITSTEPMITALPDLSRAFKAINRRLENSNSRGLGAVPDVIPGSQRIEGLFRQMNGFLQGEGLPKRSWMKVMGGQTITAMALFDGEGYLRSR